MKPNRILIVMTLAVLALSSCKKDYSAEDLVLPPVVQDHNLVIRFLPTVGLDTMVLGQEYKNYFDEPFSVTKFKFYLHSIEMINTDSSRSFVTSKDKYFLVDFEDTTTTVIKLAILPYQYNRLRFVIGVDSARNVSGAQTGALDPAKGMFWTWNTGYIMAKLEGNSTVSPAGGKFEYHIGGFSGADNTLRNPTLLFPFNQYLDLKPGKTSEMTITANAGAWFYNPHDVPLTTTPVCTTPGLLARQIADNYSKMFTVISVVNQ